MPNVSFWLALPRLFSLHKICNLLLCCFCESTFLFMPREFRCLQGRSRGLCFASWRCDETAGSWLSLPETVCVGACYAMLCYAMLLTRLCRLDICMYVLIYAAFIYSQVSVCYCLSSSVPLSTCELNEVHAPQSWLSRFLQGLAVRRHWSHPLKSPSILFNLIKL